VCVDGLPLNGSDKGNLRPSRKVSVVRSSGPSFATRIAKRENSDRTQQRAEQPLAVKNISIQKQMQHVYPRANVQHQGMNSSAL
jgi:hypothetical protein